MAAEPILVVDDTPVNLKLIRIVLANEGYQVLTAASAEEGLEILKQYRPSLILADIQLPGMDGLAFTRQVKENQATRDIAVVALTAFAMKADEQRALDAGCDGYITKPIDTRTLGELVRNYLNRRRDAPGAPPATTPPGGRATPAIGAEELHALRGRFLHEGRERLHQLLVDLDGAFDVAAAGRDVHQWVGTGGLLGYHAISRLSRDVEAILMEKPLDNSLLRETLSKLASAFTHPQEEMGA